MEVAADHLRVLTHNESTGISGHRQSRSDTSAPKYIIQQPGTRRADVQVQIRAVREFGVDNVHSLIVLVSFSFCLPNDRYAEGVR